MSKAQARRDFACIHTGCAFKTDKRKAIYTHLVRTHCERKEDYECEYCDTLFEEEAVIEEHLYTAHPGFQFRYTCVSRLENILNRCVQLAAGRKKVANAKKHAGPSNSKGPVVETNIHVRENIVNGTEATNDKPKPLNKSKTLSESSLKRKTSVNESLNNLAKLPRIIPPEESLDDMKDRNVNNDSVPIPNENVNDSLNEEQTSEFISKPSGLKITLNLKKIRDSCSRESSVEPQTGKDENDSSADLKEMSPLDESDLPHVEGSITKLDTLLQKTAHNLAKADNPTHSPASKTKSSYLENLEVYHTTDDFNRRCCPFCDYKTTKNTIRVHLSGKHKIYFVMCSKCDYRAAFPYQVQAHGFSCHKVRNIEVIHLAKSYRECVIARIKAGMPENGSDNTSTVGLSQKADMTAGDENGSAGDSSITDEPDVNVKSEELISPKIPAETRAFKPPVCQTTKTDYYNITYENETYLYCCNQCEFRTPVRATIYTHKYRHDGKTYKCGYCEFVTSSRSNVVHHIRGRHKGKAFVIEEIGADGLKLTSMVEDQLDMLKDRESVQTDIENDKTFEDPANNILAPVKKNVGVNDAPLEASETTYMSTAELNKPEKPISTEELKPQKMIIKVPEFKRTFTTVVPNRIPNVDADMRVMKEAAVSQNENGHKMSINKLYRCNPKGTPKYMCNQCPYACDTHPKMKHHLYRHKPQRYKCPYCNHRKYPRSYVVRHIRDTHRDKPMKIIDLMETGEINNNPDDSEVLNESDDMTMDISRSEDMHDSSNQEKPQLTAETRYVFNDSSYGYGVTILKDEDGDTDIKTIGQSSGCEKMNGSLVLKSPNASSINRPLHNSTPIADSALFDVGSTMPQSYSRKPVKNYDVDTKRKPRYICNFCHYGTENYKTIHNHMYRHERIKFQCPYCGFKRAPRSAVENHIRDVHKGQPIITTEFVDDDAAKTNTDGLSNNLASKSKDQPTSDSPSSRFPMLHKELKSNDAAPPSVNWPAPKTTTKVNTSPPDIPQLQVPVKPKTPGSSLSPIIPNITIPTKPLQNSVGPPNVTISASSPIPFPQKQTNSPLIMSVTPTTIKKEQSQPKFDLRRNGELNIVQNTKSSMPSYKDGGKTTFKTMYKCVFDPETCNHISKDRSKMKQHIFMHVEYKPWSCDYCNMTASQSSHVKNHVRAEHPQAEITFQYKRHNYLEKHIETFLQKGVFTVPVSEYRFIMDMKGGTKKPQYEYARDTEGYLLCPHCDYRTKSGGMADHVKMKHMQPRFKCHWCDYKAFYRSEIRKHHRKERGHAHLEFKTQELDLAEVLEDYKEGNGEIPDALQQNTLIRKTGADDLGTGPVSPSDIPQLSDLDGDTSSDADSAISDSTALSNNLSDSAFLQFSLPYSFENIDENMDAALFVDKLNSKEENVNLSDTKDATPRNTEGKRSAEYRKVRKRTKTPLFKCGYCLFSAHLRTMVKMHCQKQHPYRKVHVAEPMIKRYKTKPEIKSEQVRFKKLSNGVDNVRDNTRNKIANEGGQLSNESSKSKIAPLFRQDKTTSGNNMPVAKKSKSLKSVIDQLSLQVQHKGETDELSSEEIVLDAPTACEVNICSLNKDQVKLSSNKGHEGNSAIHVSSRKQRKPQHVLPNVTDTPFNVKNDSIDCENDTNCSSISCENGPPILTKATCDSVATQIDSVKEIDITPPLLINETEKVLDVIDHPQHS